MESTSVSGSMLSKSLDIQKSSVEKLINSAPQMPAQDAGTRAAANASNGVGTKVDIVA